MATSAPVQLTGLMAPDGGVMAQVATRLAPSSASTSTAPVTRAVTSTPPRLTARAQALVSRLSTTETRMGAVTTAAARTVTVIGAVGVPGADWTVTVMGAVTCSLAAV